MTTREMRFKLRRGTNERIEAVNEILYDGEVFVAVNQGRVVVGNGADRIKDLINKGNYVVVKSSMSEEIADLMTSPGALRDAIKSVSASSVDLSSYATSTSVTEAVSTRATTSYVDSVVSGAKSEVYSSTPYDVHRAGVIGSGDDTTTIKAAITAAGVGGTLRFRPGVTYIVSSALVPLEGQTLEMTGATIKLKDGAKPPTAIFYGYQGKPWTLVGGTIDLNRASAQAPAGFDTEACGVMITSPSSGWVGEYKISGLRVVNAAGNGVKIVGAASASMPALGSDARNAPLARVSITGYSSSGCRRGIWVDRARGVVISRADIDTTDRDGIYSFLTNGLQVSNVAVRQAGASATHAGHGFVDSYGYGTKLTNVDVDGASYNGICAGGGDLNTPHARAFTWTGCSASNCEGSGFSIDVTLALPAAERPGHTLDCAAQISGCTSTANAVHGFYLHAAAYVEMSDVIATGNGHSGVAGDAYRCTISSGRLTNNAYGLTLSGQANERRDGAKVGATGAYTGYGELRVSSAVRVRGNTSEQVLMDSTAGVIGSVVDQVGEGAPEGAVRAPAGSLWRDASTGRQWRKATTTLGTGPEGKSGWVEIAAPVEQPAQAPDPGWRVPGPKDAGLISWSFDPAAVLSQHAPLASYGYAVRLPVPAARSKAVWLVVNTAGAGVTGAYVAAYQGGALIGQSADFAADLQSVGAKRIPLQVDLTAGDVDVVVWLTGATTLPQLLRGNTGGAMSLGLPAGSARFASLGSGWSATAPASIPAKNAAGGIAYFVGIE